MLFFEETALGSEEVADHFFALAQDAAGFQQDSAVRVHDVDVLEDGVVKATAGLMHNEVVKEVLLLLSQGHYLRMLILKIVRILVSQ